MHSNLTSSGVMQAGISSSSASFHVNHQRNLNLNALQGGNSSTFNEGPKTGAS